MVFALSLACLDTFVAATNAEGLFGRGGCSHLDLEKGTNRLKAYECNGSGGIPQTLESECCLGNSGGTKGLHVQGK